MGRQIGFHVPDGPEMNLEQAMPDTFATASDLIERITDVIDTHLKDDFDARSIFHRQVVRQAVELAAPLFARPTLAAPLDSALADGEAVAWLLEPTQSAHHRMERQVFLNRPHDRPAEWSITPLYTHPAPAPLVEPDGLVERLTACANYVDDMKTRVKDGELTIFEEGAQELFREAAAALTQLRRELTTSEISRSAWKDSARINRGRADEAEGALAASERERSRLTADLDEVIKQRDEEIVRIAASEAKVLALTTALTPLASLEIPKKPQGNAGIYSIFHDHILAARAPLSRRKAGPMPVSGELIERLDDQSRRYQTVILSLTEWAEVRAALSDAALQTEGR